MKKSSYPNVADLHSLNCAEESLSCVTGPYTEQGKSLESKGSEITLKRAWGSYGLITMAGNGLGSATSG